jgi:hypothetical protein
MTTLAARTLSNCASCGSPRVTELAMTLTDGSPVDFISCHACEHRTWSQQGAVLRFDTVLAKARKPGR